jgi:hypothetical protein
MTTFTPLSRDWDGHSSGPDRFSERTTVVRGVADAHSSAESWRCLICLTGGQGSADAVSLGIAAHAPECRGSKRLAVARFDLLEAMSDASQSAYFAGWHGGIEKVLLERGGMWLLLAEQLGWPVGYLGLIGWDRTAVQALARHQISPSAPVLNDGENA